tara:strand:- start:2052 stop:2897 length:846 start_codon:yes stop_codon:yes gene_type:complete
MLDLSWNDIDERIQLVMYSENLNGAKVYGIPRGGSVVAGLMRKYGAIPVDSPSEAEFAIDDIIDSGKTSKDIMEKYRLRVLALVDKPKEQINEWVHFPWETDPDNDISDSVTRCLEFIGEDMQRDGLKETPMRVVKSWRDLYGGYGIDPSEHLKWFEDDTDEMIISKDIRFYSTCEHHMLPFFGTVAIGYIPAGKVLGLSKLSRITSAYSRRLQIQEKLTRQIAELLAPFVNGVAVQVKAQHLCMMARGVGQHDSVMVTNKLTGFFFDKPQTRAEFFKAVE